MWTRRIAHRMPWRRAALRRGSDRIQAWLTLSTIVVAVLAGPWVGWWTARTTYLAETRASAWEKQHHRPVPAVLVQDVPVVAGADGEVPPAPATTPAPARWTGPDGTVRSGAAPAPPGTRAGSTVTIWVDEHGTAVSPPRRQSPAMDASTAAALAVAGLVALLAGLRRIVIWRLDKRRLRSWEAEWLIVGPRWSRR